MKDPRSNEMYQAFLERTRVFAEYGIDMEASRRFIMEVAAPVGGRILEVGTGKGYFSRELAAAGQVFTSVDISEDEQRIARLFLRYFGYDRAVRFAIADVGRLCFADCRFDAVFMINTMHHVEHPEEVVTELHRVTAPGGKLILADFTEQGFAVLDRMHAAEGKTHRHSGFSFIRLLPLLRSRNFRIVHRTGMYQDVVVAHVPG